MKPTPAVIRYFRTAPYPFKIDWKTGQHRQLPANRDPDKGENLQSIKFANYLKDKTLTGKCAYVWTKIAHETSSKSQEYGNLMRNMGKNGGVADFVSTRKNANFWLELKDGKNKKLTDTQAFFKSWCDETESPYYIAYSFEEAVKIVESQGICKA